MPQPLWLPVTRAHRGGAGMRAWASGSAGYRSVPSAADVLEQIEAAVVVTDEAGNLLYANAFAVQLFGLPDDAASMVGRSLVRLGFEPGDAAQAQ